LENCQAISCLLSIICVALYFARDSRVELKKLTDEERKEIRNKERET